MTMWAYAVDHYAAYLLVLLRVVAFVATSPLLSLRVWPVWAKLGLSAFTALFLVPTVSGQVPDPYSEAGAYIVAALQESVAGMLLGFLATVVFSALSFTGQIIDLQVGFGAAALFDPEAGHSTGLTASFLSLLFSLYFLGLNGLDGLMLALMHSYQSIPIASFHVPASIWQVLAKLLSLTMVAGVQIGAPMWVALLLTDVTFALLARAVPQMNVFVVGQPAKLFVGLAVFAAVMPGVVYLFGSLFRLVFSQLDATVRWLGG